MSTRTLVGRITALYRYPVKGMRGEALEAAAVGWHGLDGDRRYAFVKAGSTAGFPWLSARDIPGMLLYSARFADPADPRDSAVLVTTPAGRELPLDSPDLQAELSALHGGPVALLHLYKGCQDTAALSLIGTASVDALREASGVAGLDARRFRPNLVVEVASGKPFDEESWLGEVVSAGEGDDTPLLRVDRQNVRCAVTTIDPDSGQRDSRVLKTVVEQRGERAGVYLSTQRSGMLRVGDPLYWVTGAR